MYMNIWCAVQTQTAHADPFPKNVPLMGGLNKKNKCLVLLCFMFIVFLT